MAIKQSTQIKYRPQCFTLEESMTKYKEFDSVEELVQHIIEENKGYIPKEDIIISPVIGADSRIGWNTYRHIYTRSYGFGMYRTPQGVLGYCDFGE